MYSEKIKHALKAADIQWKGVSAIIGGFLIYIVLGSQYTFGNLMIYLTSYMRSTGAPSLSYSDFIQVQSVWGITQGLVLGLSGFLVQFTGHRRCLILATAFMSISPVITYFCIADGQLWKISLSYGFLSAVGQNLAMLSAVTIPMQWFPNHRATISGVVSAGFGVGTFLFNQVQTLSMNPGNLVPLRSNRSDSAEEEYFEQPEVLDRVPNVLLYLGVTFFGFMSLGTAMISFKPSRSKENQPQSPEKAKMLESEEAGSQEALDMQALKGCLGVIFRSKIFYALWITRFCIIFINQVVIGFYKAFGQTFLKDDLLLSTIGSVAGIFNCFGRFAFGVIMDHTSYRISMATASAILGVLVATFYYTNTLGESGFSVWLWLIYLTLPAAFTMQPAICQQKFGSRAGHLVMGLVATGDVFNNLLIGCFSRFVLDYSGWIGLFATLIVPAFVAFIASLAVSVEPTETENSKRRKASDVLA